MIVYDVDQQDDEWRRLRAGVITASMFTTARKYTDLDERQRKYVASRRAGSNSSAAAKEAGYSSPPRSPKIERAIQGEDVREWSEAAKNYAFTLACERLTGEPTTGGYDTWEARRGRFLEDEAREAHSFVIDAEIERVGFVTTDDGLYGCSPDGLFEPSGGEEIKCFLAPEKVRSIVFDIDIGDVMDQVMGSLWITGREVWHMVLYFPKLASIGRDVFIHEFNRDEAYIQKLADDLHSFNALVEQYMDQIRNTETLRRIA